MTSNQKYFCGMNPETIVKLKLDNKLDEVRDQITRKYGDVSFGILREEIRSGDAILVFDANDNLIESIE